MTITLIEATAMDKEQDILRRLWRSATMIISWLSRRERRDINSLIFDLAEYKRPRDQELLLRMLWDKEIYSPIISSNVEFPDGIGTQVRLGQAIMLPTAWIQNGMSMVRFYANKDDPRLSYKFIGQKLEDAFNMIMESSNLDGIMIVNRQNSWVALEKAEIRKLLDEHRDKRK